MAELTRCKTCGHDVSTTALKCHNCGQGHPGYHIRFPRAFTIAAMTILLGSILAMFVSECSFVSASSARAEEKVSVEECVRRGEAYFREIGSYPTLSDGRSAQTVARERCNRTTTAFPE